MILAADADGYTIGNVSLPGLVANYINLRHNAKILIGLQPLVNFARDYVVICIHPEETRFSTFEELYEYSKQPKLQLRYFGCGDDGVCMAQLDNLEGSQFVHLATGEVQSP